MNNLQRLWRLITSHQDRSVASDKQQFVEADPDYRTKVIILLLLVFLLAWLSDLHFSKLISDASSDSNVLAATKRLIDLDRLSNALDYLVIVACELYLFAVAIRVVKSEQFPFPGQKVMFRTRIRKGPRIKKVGIFVLVLSSLVFGLLTWEHWHQDKWCRDQKSDVEVHERRSEHIREIIKRLKKSRQRINYQR